MRLLTLAEILQLHDLIAERTGGATGVRDFSALQSAVAQPSMTFEGKELYPDLETKAAVLCYSLTMNHPFIDGNKRIGHAAMETFLVLNEFELDATVEEGENTSCGLPGASFLAMAWYNGCARILDRSGIKETGSPKLFALQDT